MKSSRPTIAAAFQGLGYPIYSLNILGTAKLLVVIALLQTRFPLLKEWAYTGFAL